MLEQSKRVISFVALFTLIFLFVIPGNVTAQSDYEVKDEYVILYDQSHGQYFNIDNMTGAMDSLKAIETKFNTTISVEENNESFTTSSLQGADLLIISNPGPDQFVEDEERIAIETFVKRGGSILFLSNPLSNDKNISGNPKILNDFMDQAHGLFGAFHVSDIENPTVLVDDSANDGNASHILFNASTINEPALVSGVNNFTEAVFYGSGIRDTFTGSSSGYNELRTGNVTEYTYYVDENYGPNFENIYWFMERQIEETNGKTIGLGSTIMFSDLMYDNESKTRWIDAGDNSILFQNMVAFLLQITPVPEAAPIVENPFIFFINFDILIGLALTFLVAVLIFGVNIMAGRLKPTKVFDLKPEENPYQKAAAKKSKKKSTKKKKQKKRN